MSKIVLRGLLLCLSVAPLEAVSPRPQEDVSALPLTFVNRMVGIATQVTQDEREGYRVRVLHLYPLSETAAAVGEEISRLLAAEPAALFVADPNGPDAFLGVSLGQAATNDDQATDEWLASARRSLTQRLELDDDHTIYIATANNIPDVEPSLSVVSLRFPD